MTAINKKTFMQAHPFNKRKAEADRILKKYPDRVPIIIEKSNRCGIMPDIKNHKYLVPLDLTLGQFSYTIRKAIELKKDQAMFLFTNNKILPVATLISVAYEQEKNKDGFLYVEYDGENCFG